jgi:hypothetical protein
MILPGYHRANSEKSKAHTRRSQNWRIMEASLPRIFRVREKFGFSSLAVARRNGWD